VDVSKGWSTIDIPTNDNAALFDDWLTWASDSSPLLEQMLLNATARTLAMHAFLNVKASKVPGMGAQPNFRTTILWSKSDQGNTDD